MTASIDLAASRNVSWAPTIDLFYPGDSLPLDGAVVSMQVRLYPGAPGDPIVNLETVDFDDLPPMDGSIQRRIRLFPVIPSLVLQDFPTGLNMPEPGDADIFSFDAIITYSDALQDKLALGKFTLEPGVTRR